MSETRALTRSTTEPTEPVGRRGPQSAAALVAALAGAGLCLLSAAQARVTDIDDFGLAFQLGWPYWLGFGLLHAAFVTALFVRRPVRWVLAVQVTLLVLVVFGAAAFASDIPRGEAAWRHIGVIDSLVRTGTPDPTIDAYFNWPGFFALFALLAKASGLPLMSVILWAPVWNNLLWLAAVGVTLRQITTDTRKIWLAVWLFASLNWIDQDYFAPQALGFLLYLVVIALVLRWLRAEPAFSLRAAFRDGGLLRIHRVAPPWWASRVQGSGATPRQRTAALLAVILIGVAMVVSHQLTPYAAITGTAALVVIGRCLTTRLPLALGVVAMGWLTYFAAPYLEGHPLLAGSDLSATAAANVMERFDGSEGHIAVMQLRMFLTGALWALAAVGAVRQLRARQHDVIVPTLALACAPFLLLPMQSYGGEMLLRVTLFSLPFVALLAADVFLPGEGSTFVRLPARVLIIAVCVVLGATAVISRYGNARFDMFTPGEVSAIESVYHRAEPGDTLIAGAHPTPWQYRDYEVYKHTTLQELCPRGVDVTTCYVGVLDRVRQAESGRGLFLLTRANRASLEMQGNMSEANLAALERRLINTRDVRMVLDTPDARIYDIRHSRSTP